MKIQLLSDERQREEMEELFATVQITSRLAKSLFSEIYKSSVKRRQRSQTSESEHGSSLSREKSQEDGTPD
jgi:hypothetical protein